jgi:hypothetical protein
MIKRALPAVVGFLGLCLPLAAQQSENETITPASLRNASNLDTAAALTLYQPNIFGTVDSSVLIHGLPVPTVLDGRRFPVSNALARMGMTTLDFFPLAFLSAVEAPKVNATRSRDTDSPDEVEYSRLNRDFYTSGEMGLFYGTTVGKFGYETKQSYIVGTVGNDKFQITAGVSSQESSGRIPRFGR